MVGGPRCPTGKLSKLIHVLFKTFLKTHFDFLIKRQGIVDEDIEIETFNVISLNTSSIPQEFDLDALDYFLTTYQEDLHPKFKQKTFWDQRTLYLKTKR